MGLTQRRTGRYSPHDGILLPAEGFTGTPDIGCPPDVGPAARAYWATWATHPVAWYFSGIEWLDLYNTTLLADRFYETRDKGISAEMRQHEAAYFGLATRARLHVSEAGADGDPDAAPNTPRRRDDPRLKAV